MRLVSVYEEFPCERVVVNTTGRCRLIPKNEDETYNYENAIEVKEIIIDDTCIIFAKKFSDIKLRIFSGKLTMIRSKECDI